MNETDARRALVRALTDAGADSDEAESAAGTIASLATDYAAFFGNTDPDDLILPLHKGQRYWLKQFNALAAAIDEASGELKRGRLKLNEDGELDAASLALALLLARLETTAPTAWPQFVAALKVINAELRTATDTKPRKNDDRATRRLFVAAARAWRDVVGKWPSVTKRSKDDASESTFIDSPLLTALRAFAGDTAIPALSDDKFERAVKLAKRSYNQN